MAQITIYDWNNPLVPAPKPTDGSGINWTSQPSNPGMKPIIDQYTDEFKNLQNKLNADVVNQGANFGNIANRAIQPENMRPRIDTPFKNRFVTVQSAANTGQPFTQVDGQPIVKKILIPPFQISTGFRNFQIGIDNITTELEILLNNSFRSGNSQINSPTAGISWATPDGTANVDDYKNCKIYVEVDSTSAFLTPTLVSKDSFEIYTNYTTSETCPWLIKCVDKIAKNYQDPWYRVYLTLEKAPNQSAGVSMNLTLQTYLTLIYKVSNKTM